MDPLQTRLQHALRQRYRLDREIGRGGMAVVYLAEDLKHHRRVAIKVLKPELLPALGTERFLREIQIVAQLAHPNILPLHDSGEADGLLYYVMPYVEGETLRDRLHREKQLPLEDSLRIAAEVADALAYAHSLGLVHRDIKPENVLFQAGHAVVSDFGIARAVSEAAGEHLTESGLAVGTLAYMSPEQATGAKDLDGRSDIYSLGCVLYEMLAGEPPFLTSSIPAQPQASSLSVRASRETVSPAIDQVVTKALARLPADRFPTAAQFKEALEQSLTQQGAGAAMARGDARSLWRRSWPVAAGAVVVAALAVLPQSRRLEQRLLGGASHPGMIRLAVLPFENLTGDPKQEYFSDGLTDEMTSQLGRLHPEGLAVIARTSAARYKHTTESIVQIGRELGVQYLLEGSARREADTVRVTGELIRVRDQTTVWSNSYQRALAGILTLQSDVARAIANSLALTLLPQEQARLAETHAVDPAAYDDYLKGLDLVHMLTRPGLDAAQQYFEAALRKDPNYALAYSGLSYVWAARQQMNFVPAGIARPKVRAAAERAVALDSTLAEAHLALANSDAWTDWDWAGAETEFKQAMALNPSLAEARTFYAHLLLVLGRQQQAMREAQQAVELDPLNPMVHLGYAVVLEAARRWDDALAQAQIVLRTAPKNQTALGVMGAFYAKNGMFGKAIAALDAIIPPQDSLGKAAVDSGFAHGGYTAAMRAAAMFLYAKRRTGHLPSGLPAASMFLIAGDTTRTFELLQHAYDEHDPGLPYIGVLPQWDPIRRDSRFQALLRRMGLR